MMENSGPNGILGDYNCYNMIYASQENRWLFNLILLEILVVNGTCAMDAVNIGLIGHVMMIIEKE